MMSRFGSLIREGSIKSYIAPLFWHHGESGGRILDEIRQMHVNGIDSFIVESRPHPDFLGPAWWSDLRFIIQQAKSRGMKVWVFDDSVFPSGFAAGKIAKHYPELVKVFVKQEYIDAFGPLKGSSFKINAWLKNAEQVLKVVVGRYDDTTGLIIPESLEDVTEKVFDGTLYWDVPAGQWRIFIFIRTPYGEEEVTNGYLNPLDPKSVRAFIDIVYEAHYVEFKDEFGKTFSGFYCDEPRMGNCPSYEVQIGNPKIVLPYCDNLISMLSEAFGSDINHLLPYLWSSEKGDLASRVCYTYMDVVSKLYAKNFTKQIGDWCCARGVKMIGHVIEDNGAHARLGYGNGHFFRSIRGQQYSGFDIILQVWPEITSGKFKSPFGVLDADFFYWGLAKMATSEGHIDPKKQGTTVCEAFGAYGWQEGLKLMKWLTDHICVRGANFIIPHAFSPKNFPDSDCPPHFYAGGHNPQFRYFHVWADYANRVCHLLTDGKHVAPVAVVYHAEAEWAGDYEPFEKTVKTLALRQIDCDVIPIDTLVDSKMSKVIDGKLSVNLEIYSTVVIPYSQAIPYVFAKQLVSMANEGLQIIFIKEYPQRYCDCDKLFGEVLDELKNSSNATLCNHENLADYLIDSNNYDLKVNNYEEHLRYYHYNRPGEDIYFFTNESTLQAIDTVVNFSHAVDPIGYDALEDKLYLLSFEKQDDRTEVRLQLEPYESLFIIFTDLSHFDTKAATIKFNKANSKEHFIVGNWEISTATAEEYPNFTTHPEISKLQNISLPSLLPKFSGTIRYEMDFEYKSTEKNGRKFIDLGNVFEIASLKINDHAVGNRICPPYRFEVTNWLVEGANKLQVEVTNTLAKQLGDNEFDRSMPQEPSGLLGPVSLLCESKSVYPSQENTCSVSNYH